MKNKRFGKIMFVGVLNKYSSPYQGFYLVLEKLAEKMICFDYRLVNLQHGKEEMNNMFIEQIRNEKPDFIFFPHIVDEFNIDTLLKIREIYPNAITILYCGDDDSHYDCNSRYYKLLFDYCLVYQKQFLYKYKNEGATNTFVSLGTNLDNFKPLKVEKKYDAVFVGIPESDRYDYLKYLIDNGVDVRIFGRGWYIYPELQEYYGGSLLNEDFVKTMNETRINLCFSKNIFGFSHFKGRIFETAACKSFMLVEYFSEYGKIFKEGKEIVMFKDKEELLDKINYYLKNENKREYIALEAYKKVKKNFNFRSDLDKMFSMIAKKKIIHKPLPKLDKKIIELNKNDINLPEKELKEKIKSYDYVCFDNGILKKDSHKEYFQAYSLKTSKKELSCCDCYIGNSKLGDYLFYSVFYAYHRNKKDFHKMVSINQIAATKEYFLNHLRYFRDAFDGKKMDFLEKENTAFIEMCLLQMPSINYVKYKSMKNYFYPKFFYKLYSLKYQKKLFSDPYIYRLFFEILKGNFFLPWLMVDALNDKHYKNKTSELGGQVKV